MQETSEPELSEFMDLVNAVAVHTSSQSGSEATLFRLAETHLNQAKSTGNRNLRNEAVDAVLAWMTSIMAVKRGSRDNFARNRYKAVDNIAFAIATGKTWLPRQRKRAETLWCEAMDETYRLSPALAHEAMTHYSMIEDEEAREWLGFKISTLPTFIKEKKAELEILETDRMAQLGFIKTENGEMIYNRPLQRPRTHSEMFAAPFKKGRRPN